MTNLQFLWAIIPAGLLIFALGCAVGKWFTIGRGR